MRETAARPGRRSDGNGPGDAMNIPDPVKRIDIAAWVLFTTEPSDRALTGWDGIAEVDEEVRALRAYAHGEAMREAG